MARLHDEYFDELKLLELDLPMRKYTRELLHCELQNCSSDDDVSDIGQLGQRMKDRSGICAIFRRQGRAAVPGEFLAVAREGAERIRDDGEETIYFVH